MESWKDRRSVLKIIQEALTKDGSITAESLRNGSYRILKECTSFKPSFAVSILRLFGAKRFLDFSAGWGDRLIAAMAAGVEHYQAFDPNVDLEFGHRKMIQKLGPLVPPLFDAEGKEIGLFDRFRVTYQPFQTGDLADDQMFDVVFTSPPYFDFEIYSEIGGQSVKTFPNLNDWIVGFLLYSLKKAWNHLSNEGHLAIHITDVGKMRFSEIMNLFIQWKLEGACYCGVIASKGSARKARPVWVWQKRLSSQTEQQERIDTAARVCQKHFSELVHDIETMISSFPAQFVPSRPLRPSSEDHFAQSGFKRDHPTFSSSTSSSSSSSHYSDGRNDHNYSSPSFQFGKRTEGVHPPKRHRK